MSSIDEVIERSRQPGEFSERKKFTVARSRAIQKMRQFALADASHYILEWIQAAVANGATYLDLAIQQEEVRMSYVGGGFRRDELEELFDFLFASKDNLEVADVRQLALGVNALLSADPETIIIESGDGTLEGTTRVELDGKSDSVSVGTPARPLDGTYVRVLGIRRDWGEPKELMAIEERCLTATIPILVNDEPLFGYSATRSPELFGYRRTLKFDEGDLYGTIGIATTPITKNFKLLTWGTWITTKRFEFAGVPAMGGVVGYDRLRKTADHASIVQDDVYDEMWARLSAYARQLAAGQTGKATFDLALLDGTPVSARQFRALSREHGRAVVFVRGALRDDNGRALAARYGEAFDAPVFVVGEADLETVRHLGGADVEVRTPRLDPNELQFFERPVAKDPPRPWLAAAVLVPELNTTRIAERLAMKGLSSPAASAAQSLRKSNGATATVFTPAAIPPEVALHVEFRVAERSVWIGSVDGAYPGHHIVVDLEDFPIEVLNSDPSVATTMAQAVAEEAEPQLAEATTRTVEALRPGATLTSAARRIVLGIICRTAVKRLRRSGDIVVLRFALESDSLPNMLLELGVLETLDGKLLSIRDVEALLPATGGLVYGARDDAAVPAEYDRGRIIHVDGPTERLLSILVGRQSYVSLGHTTILAADRGLTCGEFAFGLRPAPDFPLFVTGSLPTAEREAAAESLAVQLYAAWQADRSSRDVARHLIWFLAHGEGPTHHRLSSEPLFRTADGQRVGFAEIRNGLHSPSGQAMYDGWSMELASGASGPRESSGETPLAMDPFVFHVLSRLGRIRPILDVDLTVAEAERNPATPAVAFLESELLDGEVDGQVGVPMCRVDDPVVLWLDRERGTAVALRDVGREFGVVGRIYGSLSLDQQAVQRSCVTACLQIYDRLIRRIPSIPTDSEEFSRALEAVLDYSASRVHILEGPDGSLVATVADPTALRILDLPVFPTTAGVAVTPWRMLREFVTFGDRRPRAGRARLAEDAPVELGRWLDHVLNRERIAPHPTASPGIGPPTELDRWLTAALQELRTDEDQRTLTIRVIDAHEFASWAQRLGVTDSDLFVEGETAFLSRESWLVQNILVEDSPTRESASWLLLAVYAQINKLRLSVTNIHELHFQSRVLDWLDQ